MPLVDMRDMLQHAYQNNYAIGGFGLVSLDFLEAIIMAAECCRSPVIINLSQPLFGEHDFRLILPAVERAAQLAKVPVAIHFDHAKQHESIVQAINLGCNSVMLDVSSEAFTVNIAQTSRATKIAHASGAAIEGMLGFVGGTEGENAINHLGEIIYTSAEEAKVYVNRTKVDCLAVSIGTVHGRQSNRAKLDFKRLKRINDELGIPLVLHGGSGLIEDQYHKLILNGVAKINCYTELSDIAAATIRSNVQTRAKKGYIETMHDVKNNLLEQVSLCMHHWGSAGRAAEVLIQCRAWQPVEQIIAYNVEERYLQHIDTFIERSRETLCAIPGVRQVFAGWALIASDQYHLCWRIQFATTDASKNFQTHAEYLAFIEQLARISEPDKINITFAATSVEPNPRIEEIRISPAQHI
ncbi:fructose-bisphosphate aldolase class II [Nitrosomonas ureae]|uniref:class II fructose-bisphosphate aldolase n=1 Tax=Nitrosomonas ureae TaxID=44577 RepID=UPI000D76D521|nr:class II fructose-bisphosphate aldolase [Nitrosomonas ureae]PXX17909.1 fructose-bisphosphate aldolase class II [Nitrosomonas ureae]